MARILMVALIYILLLGCNRDLERDKIEMTLEISGANRVELERVLDHYKQDTEDELKYRSACYLIANMWGHCSLDSTDFSVYKPFIETRDSLLLANNYSVRGKYLREYDLFWSNYRTRIPPRSLNNSIQADIKHITATYLIDHIDRSFLIWESSPYRSNINFDDFCQYILPYRSFDKLWLGDGQDYFFSLQDKLLPHNISSDIRVTADSVLKNYEYLKHNRFYASGFPILCYKHLLNNRTSSCTDRAWLNSTILNSIGIPTAIDMVPLWSNRDNSHSWNVVITADSSYACDPFWEDEGQWKYKKLYNNREEDIYAGAFRLPKVFRYTYELVLGPILDKRVAPNNIPNFFTSPHWKDVSSEYFETHDLNIELQTPPPENSYYAYLGVYNGGGWKPVQWGEIEGDHVTFKAMGSNNLYIPLYSCYNQFIPAGPPLFLNSDGTTTFPKLNRSNVADIVIDRNNKLYPYEFDHEEYLYQMEIEYSTDNEFKDIVASRTITDQDTILYYRHNIFSIKSDESARFIRLSLPNKALSIGEIKFYIDSLETKPIRTYSSLNIDNDRLKHLTDGYMSTKTEIEDITPDNWIAFDFGAPVSLSHITICPGASSNMRSRGNYTILGWEDGSWIDLKRVYMSKDNPDGNTLIFKDIPQEGLYKITIPNSRKNRIFMYDKGTITWY